MCETVLKKLLQLRTGGATAPLSIYHFSSRIFPVGQCSVSIYFSPLVLVGLYTPRLVLSYLSNHHNLSNLSSYPYLVPIYRILTVQFTVSPLHWPLMPRQTPEEHWSYLLHRNTSPESPVPDMCEDIAPMFGWKGEIPSVRLPTERRT